MENERGALYRIPEDAQVLRDGYQYPQPGETWTPQEIDLYLCEHHEAPEGRDLAAYDRAAAERFWDARFKVLMISGGAQAWTVSEREVDSMQLMQLLHGYGESRGFLISVQPVDPALRQEIERLSS